VNYSLVPKTIYHTLIFQGNRDIIVSNLYKFEILYGCGHNDIWTQVCYNSIITFLQNN
jgi:hypothetical protein